MKVRSTFSNLSVSALAIFLGGCSITEPPKMTANLGNVFVSSMDNQALTSYDFSNPLDVQSISFKIPHNKATGLMYDGDVDAIYQVDASSNQIVVFANLAYQDTSATILPFSYSRTEITKVQGMTGTGSVAILAQVANAANNFQNQLITYYTSFNELKYLNTKNISFEPWDVFISGNTLFVSEVNSDSLSIFNSYPYKEESNIEPDLRVQIEGIQNMSGVYYDASSDIMFISDSGDVLSDSDGSIHVIEGFYNKFTQAILDTRSISLIDQSVIEGTNTFIGNPCDIVFDKRSNLIVVAENLNGGGRILGYNLTDVVGSNSSINLTPTVNIFHKAASALSVPK